MRRKWKLKRLLKVGLVATAVLSSTTAFAVEGEVMKINEAAGKITLQHGPIANLNMDSMRMVFRVADPSMLNAVAVGDKVNFEADRVDGAITIIQIEKAN